MKNFLLTLNGLLLLLSNNLLNAQSVSVLPGESPSASTGYQQAFTGDFNVSNSGSKETFCAFNQAKGMLSIGLQTQSNNVATWNDIRVSFFWGGTWYSICGISEANPSIAPGIFYQNNSSYTNTLNNPSTNKYMSGGDGYNGTFNVSTNNNYTYNRICGDNFNSI